MHQRLDGHTSVMRAQIDNREHKHTHRHAHIRYCLAHIPHRITALRIVACSHHTTGHPARKMGLSIVTQHTLMADHALEYQHEIKIKESRKKSSLSRVSCVLAASSNPIAASRKLFYLPNGTIRPIRCSNARAVTHTKSTRVPYANIVYMCTFDVLDVYT